MSVNLRFPNITATTEAGQLQQIQSYMHQLVEQLNWALTSVDGEISKVVQTTTASSSSSSSNSADAIATFNDIKALIIKSADIVNAYYDEINTRLEGVYVAESAFGSYAQQTTADIKANSTNINTLYNNLQAIITDIDNLEHSVIEANAYINSGLLYYDSTGVPIYGLEIGQRNEIDGVEVFNKYARFTSDKLSFYDRNDNEVAYVSDKKLYITIVEVTGSFIMGGFVDTVLSDGSVVTKWVG